MVLLSAVQKYVDYCCRGRMLPYTCIIHTAVYNDAVFMLFMLSYHTIMIFDGDFFIARLRYAYYMYHKSSLSARFNGVYITYLAWSACTRTLCQCQWAVEGVLGQASCSGETAGPACTEPVYHINIAKKSC